MDVAEYRAALSGGAARDARRPVPLIGEVSRIGANLDQAVAQLNADRRARPGSRAAAATARG